MARSTSTGTAEVLTIKQVALYLQVTERTIYRLAAAEGIPAFKVGGSWRFRRGDLDHWIEGRIGKSSGADKRGGEMTATSTLQPAQFKSEQVTAIPVTDGFAMRDGFK